MGEFTLINKVKIKFFLYILLIIIISFFIYSCEEKRIDTYVEIDKEIEYFYRINPIFKTEYDIEEALEIVNGLGSNINIYTTETLNLNRIIQFGGFTIEERRDMNIKSKLINLNLGYLSKPDNLIKECKDISVLVRLDNETKYIVGWKFTLDRNKGEEIIKAIENEYGLAGNVHDAFGWKSKSNRYLYTIYPNDITFTIISDEFITKLLSLLGK